MGRAGCGGWREEDVGQGRERLPAPVLRTCMAAWASEGAAPRGRRACWRRCRLRQARQRQRQRQAATACRAALPGDLTTSSQSSQRPYALPPMQATYHARPATPRPPPPLPHHPAPRPRAPLARARPRTQCAFSASCSTEAFHARCPTRCGCRRPRRSATGSGWSRRTCSMRMWPSASTRSAGWQRLVCEWNCLHVYVCSLVHQGSGSGVQGSEVQGSGSRSAYYCRCSAARCGAPLRCRAIPVCDSCCGGGSWDAWHVCLCVCTSAYMRAAYATGAAPTPTCAYTISPNGPPAIACCSSNT